MSILLSFKWAGADRQKAFDLFTVGFQAEGTSLLFSVTRSVGDSSTSENANLGQVVSMRNQIHSICAALDQRRVDFLKTDLSLCLTFVDLAATRLKMGHRETSKQALVAAEKGYTSLSHFLSDPKHASHLTADRLGEFTAELRTLRERLDGLQGNH